jgi:DNA-binding MarR family transcriptional regulator
LFHSAAIHALRHVERAGPDSLRRARLSALSVLVSFGPKTVGELADGEQVGPATMTAILQALEDLGLALRTSDPSDGRLVRVRATPKGRQVIREARERRIVDLAALLSRLSDAEIDTVKRCAVLIEQALIPPD